MNPILDQAEKTPKKNNSSVNPKTVTSSYEPEVGDKFHRPAGFAKDRNMETVKTEEQNAEVTAMCASHIVAVINGLEYTMLREDFLHLVDKSIKGGTILTKKKPDAEFHELTYASEKDQIKANGFLPAYPTCRERTIVVPESKLENTLEILSTIGIKPKSLTSSEIESEDLWPEWPEDNSEE